MSFIGDPIGAIRYASGCGACGPAVQDRSHCSDLGPEWSYNGYGRCGDCSFNCVKLFGKDVCTIGTHAKCRKNQHLGDRTMCCLGNQPNGYPAYTCDPSYTPLSSSCVDVMQNFCSQNNGKSIFTNSMCKNWDALNKELGFEIKKKYCNLNNIYTDQNCKNWLASGETQGKLDDLMLIYCLKFAKPDDPLCSCINSEIPCPNKFDMKCVQNPAYKTYEMITVKCPDVLNCTQFTSLSPGAQAIATSVEQKCPTQSPMISPPGTPGSMMSTISSIDKDAKIPSGLWIFLIVFIAIIIIGVIIFVIVRKMRKNKISEKTILVQ